MTYMFLLASCLRCGKTFGSNPELVPTVRDANNVKQPICGSCVSDIQALQRNMNVPVWPSPMPGAYEPVEQEL
jgi:hypothetical protein